MSPEPSMIDEILKSAKAQISERIASPLIGSFSLSWCLWNYKFLVILFSNTSVSQTFSLVDSVAFPTTGSLVINGVLLPALTAVIYIFVYPYPARFVYEFTRRRQKEINEIRQRVEDETLLTIEESRKIRADIVQFEKKHQEEVDRLNTEISRIKDEVTNRDSVVPPKTTDADARSTQSLVPTQLALLRLLEKQGGSEEEGRLIQLNQQSKVKTEFDLGELVQMKLVKKDYDQDHMDYVYEFTHEGRRILLTNGESEAHSFERPPV